ncbi:transposase [Weissella viridescens]|uniref:transposase n=1 Tax=Weissella viridescens TaxID=1629 RepID=UPI001FABECD8|nr:transposase [Weissella viridescens]WJI90499.1 helix-turn-helix domain-containing protein [Weissella viridescens]
MYARAKGKYLEWTTEEGLSQLEGWARDGLTDEQIAKNIGIRRSALYSWKKDHLDIMDALKKGKEVVDYQVENALLKKALGMTVVEQQFKVVHVDGDILSVERKKFAIAWEIEHPDATQKEINDAAIQNVPEYKKIPFGEYHKELAPDTNAAMFWLKNRRPDKYREQSLTKFQRAK